MNESTQPQRIAFLLNAYADQTAKPAEIRELFLLLDREAGDEKLKSAVLETLRQLPVPEIPGSEFMWQGIRRMIGLRRRRLLKRTVATAAALGLLLGLLLNPHSRKAGENGRMKAETTINGVKSAPDVPPGTNKAVLILSNGEKIFLDSARDGSIAEQGNVQIVKLSPGRLAYQAGGKGSASGLYNSIHTPRGGQYQVNLPDGTMVWLDASSSLRFPTCFTGADRRVELTGEAYFEVAKNAGRPFHVLIGATDIKVLGTHFNVMGYANEKVVTTTLLEGKVDVTSSGRTKKLVPGKAAVITSGAGNIAVGPANVEQAVAWKNGLFRFHETGIRSIMRQVERWYDVDVEYQTAATDQDFTGVISRSENLAALLQTLELTGTVHFQIAGKRVIVLP